MPLPLFFGFYSASLQSLESLPAKFAIYKCYLLDGEIQFPVQFHVRNLEFMRLLESGLSGPDILQWQVFLRGQNFSAVATTGAFDEPTRNATIAFQQLQSLLPDGRVGNRTLSAAIQLGFAAARDEVAFPDFPALTSNAARQEVFGTFNYQSKPIPNNPENIVIAGTWQRENIVAVVLPQLIGVAGAPKDGRIWFHKKAAAQLVTLWSEWADAGLLDRVESWGGSFVPRFVRGSRSVLSNHSFGSAFDINMAHNPLGGEPAALNHPGCVGELVQIAHRNGFYWGGHFSRKDGMHFEVAVLR
ncbi:MAG: M15 family metallopeptidase [Chloroflexia bacterium]